MHLAVSLVGAVVVALAAVAIFVGVGRAERTGEPYNPRSPFRPPSWVGPWQQRYPSSRAARYGLLIGMLVLAAGLVVAAITGWHP